MFPRVDKLGNIRRNIAILKCFLHNVPQGGQTGKHSMKHSNSQMFLNNVSQGGQTGKHSRKHSNSQMFPQQCSPGWTDWETFEETRQFSNVILEETWQFSNVSQGGQNWETFEETRQFSNVFSIMFPRVDKLGNIRGNTAILKCNSCIPIFRPTFKVTILSRNHDGRLRRVRW